MSDEKEWIARHVNALVSPTPMEEPMVDLMTGLLKYVTQYEVMYGSDGMDYVLGAGVGQVIDGLRVLLNGDLGRLDAGTLDEVLLGLAERAGWDADRSEWVGHTGLPEGSKN